MPSISYRDLLAGEATTEIVYNGHAITLTYDPNAITDNVFREIKRLAASAAPLDGSVEAAKQAAESGDTEAQNEHGMALLDELIDLGSMTNTLLRRFLLKWDLALEDGVTMFPLTDEMLGNLPLDFRQQVLRALMSAGRMGEANGTTTSQPSAASTRTATRAGSRR